MTPIPATHADHDPLAIAAYAAGDADGYELDDALALVAGCSACAALHHDLRSIAAATSALPAPVRSRDFRITPTQAAALHPSGWRRLLAPFAGPRFAFAGPLGTGLATLGIAGLLVAGAAGLPLAGAGVVVPAATVAGQGTGNTAAVPGPGADQAASAAPASQPALAVPEMAPGPGSDVPAASAAPGAGGPAGAAPDSGVVITGSDPYATATGPGTAVAGAGRGAALAAPSAEPKTSDPAAGLVAASPVNDAVQDIVDDAADAPSRTTPSNAPIVVIAAALLVAGILLGGLRLVARRAA